MSINDYIEALMIRYFLEEINEEELRELDIWLNASPKNKDFFFRMKKISDVSRRSIWSEAEKEASWQRMYSKLSNSGSAVQDKNTSPKRYKLLSLFKYAAAIVLLFTLGWGMNDIFSGMNEPELAVIEPVYNEIRVEKGGRGNTLMLSDGSKVILNASTTFRYPTDFTTGDRTVYLDGEAYFEVAKDESKPFIVKLKRQDITVLGTSFNIEAYQEENYSVVTLLNGSISLDSFNEAGIPMSRMFLKPNQRAISDNLSGSVSLEDIDTSLAEAWTNGKYKFKDESLSAIARRLERYYNVRIVIESESLKQIKHTGTFSLDQDIQEVLLILDQEKHYKVKQVGKKISIVKR